jgi:hypothetical protein
MTGCSVEGCKNRSEDGIIFKSIPKNPYKRSIWTKHMNRTPPKKFEIYGKVLKKHAALSEVLIKFKHIRKNVCCVTG